MKYLLTLLLLLPLNAWAVATPPNCAADGTKALTYSTAVNAYACTGITGSGGTVTVTGTPLIGQLTQFSSGTSITNGNLSGDVTTGGSAATTLSNTIKRYIGQSVNLTQAPYSAACDGTTDDSAALTSALAGGTCVFVPRSANGCIITNVTIPTNACIVGANGPSYDTIGTKSRLKAKAAATVMLNVASTKGVYFGYLDIDGNNGGSVNCISSGSFLMSLDHINVRNCANGAVGDISVSTQAMLSNDAVLYGNTGGYINLIDSQIVGGSVSGGTNDGIYLPNGANDNAITGTKIEFNTGYGINCFQCARLTYSGGVSDSNSKGGVSLSSCSAVSITGVDFRRNGSNAVYGQDQHIYLNGACNGVSIVGNTTVHGVNDGGGGVDRPDVSILVNAATDTNLNIQGNDLSGNVNGFGVYYNAIPSSGIILNNTGTTPSVTGTFGGTAYGALQLNAMGAQGTMSLGTNGGTIGTLKLLGSSTGTLTITTQAAAGTPTWTAGTSSGTPVVTASSPLSITTATGNITCATCATTGGANIPTVAQGDILYGSAANMLSALTKDTNATRYLSNTGTTNNPAWAQVALSTGISGFGTGVATALAVNTGSAGAVVLFNGAGGTPSSLTGTNITGTASGLTAGTASAVAVGGITGLGTGVATWLATPSSSNLISAVTDETGTGALVFATSPTLVTPTLGVATSSSIVVTSTVAPTSGYGMYKFDATTLAFANNGSAGATLSGGTFLAAAALNSLGPVNATTSVSGAGFLSTGTKFTTTGAGCTVASTVGGATAGQFTANTTGTCTTIITMGGLTSANGWSCWARDRTVPANGGTTASSTTTATIAVATVSGNTVDFGCIGY